MDYELAKKLKEKGFPQATGGFYYWNRDLIEACDINPFYNEKIITHTIKIPTLSELIEACGNKFSSLTRSPRNTWYVAQVKNGSEVELVVDIECSTPEEAVSHLWLELQK